MNQKLTFNRSDPVVFSAKCGTGVIYIYINTFFLLLFWLWAWDGMGWDGMGWVGGEMLSYDILVCLLF